MDKPAAWYAQGDGLRWWDGARWTGMRVTDGTPGVDWITADKAVPLFLCSALFFVAGVVHLSLVAFSPLYLLTGVLFMGLAIFWLFGAMHVRRIAKLPAPSAEPVVIDEVRPLPGEQEGPGAGWYPVSSTVGRWWTGIRWSQYTWTRSGIRPTFHGTRSFRILLWMGGLFVVIGVLALVAGIVVVNAAGDPTASGIGIVVIVCGSVFVLTGLLLLALSPLIKRPLVIPSSPPTPVSSATAPPA